MTKNNRLVWLGAVFGLSFSILISCSQAEANSNGNTADNVPALTAQVKPAQLATEKNNQQIYKILDFNNKKEAEFAAKGLIDAPKELELKDENGNVVWSQKAYDFVNDYDKAPSTVNPSLWENTKNNHNYGLFKVTDGIYQVRGYDMANLTLVEGNTGWIVLDTLMSTECSKAAMQLVEKNLGKRPVKAIIISHPHVDHFGGIKGVIDESQIADPSLPIDKQLASGKTPIIVPQNFEAHAITENLYLGPAMGRRANYQYGKFLEKSPTGALSIGIGMGQSTGSISYISPTYEITKTGEKLSIDGVDMEFQMTPGTEAPAEMNTWFPQKKALWFAENCTATLHNLYTLRGAEVRSGSDWSRYIMETLSRYGNDAEVTFQAHDWPHWGNDFIKEYMLNTAAAYKYIDEQTMTYINQGYTSNEISNMIKLPDKLAANWYTRPYYGTVSHNAKAVYQKYMGWYSANPVDLNPLSPEENGKKWVEYLGGTEKALKMAKKDFEKGNYQWVAQLTNAIVFAQPNNKEARLLCADALEQLGYQAESGAWRNAYLTGASELRNGIDKKSVISSGGGKDMLLHLTPDMLFEYMGILINKQAIADKDFSVNISLTDSNENYVLWFKNGVLLYDKNKYNPNAELTIKCPAKALLYFPLRNKDAINKTMQLSGDTSLVDIIVDNLNEFTPTTPVNFNIVEP